MSELISIIVPVYNCEKYIADLLCSLKNQTYQNLEIIVIDDGSTDSTLEIARGFSEEDERFKIIHQENSGVSAARNQGLKLAKGSIIGFADGDDFCEPTQFSELYNSLTEHNADISISALSFEYPNRTIIQGEEFLGKIVLLDKEQAVIEMFRGKMFSGHNPNKLFRKKVCNCIQFDEDISISEDMLFCLKSFANANRIIFLGKPLYHYYMRDNSVYHQGNINKMYTAFVAYGRMRECIALPKFSEKIMPSFEISYTNLCIGLFNAFRMQKETKDERYDEVKKEFKRSFNRSNGEMTFVNRLRICLIFYCGVPFNFIQKVKSKIKSKILFKKSSVNSRLFQRVNNKKIKKERKT